MNRFGKAIVAILVLAGIAVASMIRFGEAPPPAPVAPPAPQGMATTADAVQPAVPAAPGGLAIPVAGVPAAALADSFGDARDGHVHDAIDIMAAHGTPVVAAAPGRVEKLFESEAGGHTVYVRSDDGRWSYYYAHLDGYAPGLAEGQRLARGAAIGTVGSSGNADAAGPHLHFAIHAMRPGEPWHGGQAINPYRVLTAG